MTKKDIHEIIEIKAIGLFSLILFTLGATRAFSAYTVYAIDDTMANFLFTEFCTIMLAFGVIGMIVSGLRGVIFLKKYLANK